MQESKTDQATNSSPAGQEGQSSESEKRVTRETSSSPSATAQTLQTQVRTLTNLKYFSGWYLVIVLFLFFALRLLKCQRPKFSVNSTELDFPKAL